MAKLLTDDKILRLDSEDIPLDLRVSPRARRMNLRVDPASGDVRLTLPHGMAITAAEDFVRQHVDWIRVRRATATARVPFADGSRIPILGRDHLIRRIDGRGAKGVAWREFGILWVTGQPAHTARRVRDFLKAEARRQIVDRAQSKAETAGRKIRRISLRDPRSRWGSCASGGNLNFSWRLILAPEGVLDYVVAHEVAHLVHMNHSPAFWRTVATLTDADVKAQRAWLRRHGNGLFAYGPAK